MGGVIKNSAITASCSSVRSSSRMSGIPSSSAGSESRQVDGSQLEDRESQKLGVIQELESSSSTVYRDAFSRVFSNGGSSFDAWLNSTSFQVSQVLLNLPFSFAQMGMASGLAFQLLYGLMGCWASYMMASLYLTYRNMKEKQKINLEKHIIQWYEVLEGLLGPWGKAAALILFSLGISSAATIQMVSCASAAYYMNDKIDKRTWTFIFGPFFMLTLLIPAPRNYRMWSFVAIVMTTYVAWYLTIAAAIHGKEPGVRHSGPTSFEHYFTGASNILYTFGGHGLTVEIAGAMWRPKRFKVVYFYAVLYVFTLTLPSAATVYWAFGDKMLHNSNAFAVLPRSKFRDAAVVLIIIHQFFEFGLLALPLCLMCEKLVGIHHTKHYLLKVAARVPLFLFLWIGALMMPFFGPIDSINGSFFTSFAVYVLPCMAHMIVYRSASARKNAIEQPPFWMPSWVGVYCINLGIMIWVLVVGVGLGGWASISNLSKLVHNFGLFVKCYQCPKKS